MAHRDFNAEDLIYAIRSLREAMGKAKWSWSDIEAYLSGGLSITNEVEDILDVLRGEATMNNHMRARVHIKARERGMPIPVWPWQKANAVLDENNQLIGWRDEPDANPYIGSKTVREVLRERGETLDA